MKLYICPNCGDVNYFYSIRCRRCQFVLEEECEDEFGRVRQNFEKAFRARK